MTKGIGMDYEVIGNMTKGIGMDYEVIGSMTKGIGMDYEVIGSMITPSLSFYLKEISNLKLKAEGIFWVWPFVTQKFNVAYLCCAELKHPDWMVL